MLGQHGRGFTRALFTHPVLMLDKIGITPNVLTVVGSCLSVIVALATLPQGHFIIGSLLLTLVLLADSCDGILARATGKESVFGAFLDSTLDRIADGAVFSSLTLWVAWHMSGGAMRSITLVAGVFSIVLAGVVPYARARAESIGAQANVGIAERTDRLTAALLATFITGLTGWQWILTIGLILVVLGSFITVVQRLVTVYSQTKTMLVKTPVTRNN